MKTKQQSNIAHIREVADLQQLDAAKKWTLLIYQSALSEMNDRDYITILNLTSCKNLNNKGTKSE